MGEARPNSPYNPEFTSARNIILCGCEHCAISRQPPEVTDEMRSKWAAMGLEVTKTPQPTTRKEYRASTPKGY